MYETPITVIGNLSFDPVVRTTHSGAPVTNFRIASTARRFNKQTKMYEDGDTLWIAVVCWQEIARNAAESLHKGDSVIVYGRLASREYVKDEMRRVNFEMTADAIGHNLARGTSTFTRIKRAPGATSVPMGEDGLPEDMTEELLERRLREEELAAEAFDSADFTALPGSGPLVPTG